MIAFRRQRLDARVARAESLQPPGRDEHLAPSRRRAISAHRLAARLANGADLVGRRGHRRPAVENVDVAVEREALMLEHPQRRLAARMRLAHDRLRAIGEQRHVNRESCGIRSAMNWVPWTALNSSASGKVIPKNLPASASQNGAWPASSITPRSSASVRSPNRAAMLLHEQIAASGEQRAPAAGAHLRVQEQAADLGRSFEIGGERKALVAEGLAELGAGLGQCADVIAVEGLDHADLAEHLAGAADLLRLGILQHEHVKVAGLAVVPRARTTFRSARALRPKCRGPPANW